MPVDADYPWGVRHLRSGNHALTGLIGQPGRDELQAVEREFQGNPAHTDLHKVAVLAVVIYPFLQLLLVGAFDGAAVNLRALPAMLVFAEALAESPVLRVGLPNPRPDNFRVLVRQRALGNLPDRISNVEL